MRSKLWLALVCAILLWSTSRAEESYVITIPPSSIDHSYSWGKQGMVRLRMVTYGDNHQIRFIKFSLASSTMKVPPELYNDLMDVNLHTATVGLRDDGHYIIGFQARKTGSAPDASLLQVSLCYSGNDSFQRSLEEAVDENKEAPLPATLRGDIASMACKIGTMQVKCVVNGETVVRLVHFSPNTPLLRKEGGSIGCDSLLGQSVYILTASPFHPNSDQPLEAAVVIVE